MCCHNSLRILIPVLSNPISLGLNICISSYTKYQVWQQPKLPGCIFLRFRCKRNDTWHRRLCKNFSLNLFENLAYSSMQLRERSLRNCKIHSISPTVLLWTVRHYSVMLDAVFIQTAIYCNSRQSCLYESILVFVQFRS